MFNRKCGVNDCEYCENKIRVLYNERLQNSRDTEIKSEKTGLIDKAEFEQKEKNRCFRWRKKNSEYWGKWLQRFRDIFKNNSTKKRFR